MSHILMMRETKKYAHAEISRNCARLRAHKFSGPASGSRFVQKEATNLKSSTSVIPSLLSSYNFAIICCIDELRNRGRTADGEREREIERERERAGGGGREIGREGGRGRESRES